MSEPADSYMPGDWVTLLVRPRSAPMGVRVNGVGRVKELAVAGYDWRVLFGDDLWPVYVQEVRLATPDEIAQACMASPEGEL